MLLCFLIGLKLSFPVVAVRHVAAANLTVILNFLECYQLVFELKPRA